MPTKPKPRDTPSRRKTSASRSSKKKADQASSVEVNGGEKLRGIFMDGRYQVIDVLGDSQQTVHDVILEVSRGVANAATNDGAQTLVVDAGGALQRAARASLRRWRQRRERAQSSIAQRRRQLQTGVEHLYSRLRSTLDVGMSKLVRMLKRDQGKV